MDIKIKSAVVKLAKEISTDIVLNANSRTHDNRSIEFISSIAQHAYSTITICISDLNHANNIEKTVESNKNNCVEINEYSRITKK